LFPQPSVLLTNAHAYKRVALVFNSAALRVLVVLFALLLSVAAFSQNTFITGTDSAHAGWQIAAFVPSDYISGKRDLIAETMISANGSFALALNISQTCEVHLVVLHVQANMYLEPGHICYYLASRVKK
jgi:hypothetical protein